MKNKFLLSLFLLGTLGLTSCSLVGMEGPAGKRVDTPYVGRNGN